MKITFARLKASQTAMYRELRLESLKNYPENYGSTYEEEKVHPKLAFEKYIDEEQHDHFMVGAFDTEKLIGICGFARETGMKRNHRGSIIQMYLKPEYRGSGFGLQLLQAAIEEAFRNSEIEQLILGVLANNKPAIAIYHKAGFTEYGFLKNYFKKGATYFDQRFMAFNREKQ
jgi:ribosomal protein S18 acetylase RimI-like enzyme